MQNNAPVEPEHSANSFWDSGAALFTKPTDADLLSTDWQTYGYPLLATLIKIDQNAHNNPNFLQAAILKITEDLNVEPGRDSTIPGLNGTFSTRGKLPYKRKLAAILHKMMIIQCDTLTEDNFPLEIYKETDGLRHLRISRVFKEFSHHIYGVNFSSATEKPKIDLASESLEHTYYKF